MTQLLDALRGRPERPALVIPGGPTLSYAQLREMVEEAAGRLAGLGVRRGDRVAMSFPNGPEAIVLFLAAATAGTACPLNPAYTEDENAFYLEDTDARLVLVPRGGGQAARAAAERLGGRVVEVEIDAQGRLHLDAPRAAYEPPGEDDVALVLHTSGTTSRPKRVPLRHRNLLASVANIAESYRLTDEDVSLCVMPLFHVHGLMASTMATFFTGGTVVAPAKFTPLAFWPVAKTHQPTWYSASPTFHQLILMRAERGGGHPAGTERLRFVRSCSSAMPETLMREIEERLGAPLLEAYGMTEASHQMASNPLPPGARKPGSVGPATGSTEVGIMDEGGRLLSQGEAGEVVIRGPNVVDGYEGNPTANAESFTDGWFRTGDRGTLDGDGYLILVGRIKELINRGGEKIAPREIDEVLESHPRVKEAVAFASPHPTWGEEVAVAVVAEDVTEKELTAWCRERLAEFKVPRVIHIVDQIPRTATGKVQRRNVAAAFAAKD